jgi:hypothetical protein
MTREYDISLRISLHFESEEADFHKALLQHLLAHLSVNQPAEIHDTRSGEYLHLPVRLYPAAAVRSMTPQSGESPRALSSPRAPQ